MYSCGYDKLCASVTVSVPATSANLGPGFDSLAVAWKLYNHFTVSTTDEVNSDTSNQAANAGFAPENPVIEVTGEGADHIARDSSNLFWRAFASLWEKLGRNPPNVKVQIQNDVPFGQGLGSSATAVIGGLVAANAMAGYPLDEESILRMAGELESHPDNISAALLGGFTASGVFPGGPVAVRFPWDFPFIGVLALPDYIVETSEARKALPELVPFRDAVHNINRTSLLIAGLARKRKDLLLECMDDRLHQNYRAHLMPGARECMKMAREAGALGVAVSGAGPAIVAFCESPEGANRIGEAMVAGFRLFGHEARFFVVSADDEGAFATVSNCSQ